METIRIRYDEEDRRLERIGIVTPKGSRVVAHTGRGGGKGRGFIVAKIAGGSYTSGQNMRAYGAARFVLYEEVYSDVQRALYDENPTEHWLREGDVDGWITVHDVMTWPVRS